MIKYTRKDEGRKLQEKEKRDMKKMVNDGWHMVYGYPVYVEDGKVKRAVSNGVPAYHYRASKYGCWVIDTHMTLDALRAGMSRETVTIK